MPVASALWPRHGISEALQSTPSGLQVSASFQTLGLRSCGASCGGQLGPCSRSVACLRGGHLALRLASTVRGFGASTSPLRLQVRAGGNRLQQKCSPAAPPPASSGSSATHPAVPIPCATQFTFCRLDIHTRQAGRVPDLSPDLFRLTLHTLRSTFCLGYSIFY